MILSNLHRPILLCLLIAFAPVHATEQVVKTDAQSKFVKKFRLPNGKTPNGYPCFGAYQDKQCDSGYCAQLGPTLRGVPMKWCYAHEVNCPAPGQHGIMYEGEYNFDGQHWYCKSGVGLLNDGVARDSGPRGGKIESRVAKKLEDAGIRFLDSQLEGAGVAKPGKEK